MEASCHESPWEHFAWNPIIPDAPGADGSTNSCGAREIKDRVCGKQRITSEVG